VKSPCTGKKFTLLPRVDSHWRPRLFALALHRIKSNKHIRIPAGRQHLPPACWVSKARAFFINLNSKYETITVKRNANDSRWFLGMFRARSVSHGRFWMDRCRGSPCRRHGLFDLFPRFQSGHFSPTCLTDASHDPVK
jgi:hypothetical protein